MTHRIIDNFLSDDEFEKLHSIILESGTFGWFLQKHIVDEDMSTEKSCFLCHRIYHDSVPTSSHYDLIKQLLIDKIKPIALLRIRVNFYPNVGKYIEHKLHKDLKFPHHGAIFHLNTNNGFTILENGTKIESVANRLVLLDTHEFHQSTTCTDVEYRANININYI
jgi:hypothetical protein